MTAPYPSTAPRRPMRPRSGGTGTPTGLGRPVMGRRQGEDFREDVPPPERITGASDAYSYSPGAVRDTDLGPATTRQVQANELTSEQLRQLGESTNPLLAAARSRAIRYQASRGLTPNSNLAGAAGEQAFYEYALPVAQADAGVYGRTASENMAAQNQFGLEAGRNELERSLAESRNALDADRIYAEREQGALERNLTRERDQFQRRFSEREREDIQRFQTDQNRQRARAEATAYFMDTVFSDPSFWRDPQGASGFVQFWNEVAWPMFDEIFGPLDESGP